MPSSPWQPGLPVPWAKGHVNCTTIKGKHSLMNTATAAHPACSLLLLVTHDQARVLRVWQGFDALQLQQPLLYCPLLGELTRYLQQVTKYQGSQAAACINMRIEARRSITQGILPQQNNISNMSTCYEDAPASPLLPAGRGESTGSMPDLLLQPKRLYSWHLEYLGRPQESF
jgi:hypothetical protein